MPGVKEKSTPLARFAGVLPAKSAPACGVSRAHILCARKTRRHPCRRPFGHGALPVLCTDTDPAASLCRSTGAPEEQADLLSAGVACTERTLFRRAGRALAFSGPLCSGGWWMTRPAGASAGMHSPFRQHRMCCRKAQPPHTDPADRRSAGRGKGVASLLVRFLWPNRENELAPEGRESS